MAHRISVIIPSYNSRDTIRVILDSLLNLKHAQCLEEIIIVDSSDDIKTRAIIREYADTKIKLLSFDNRLTPAESRNTGAKHAKGNILVFLDADTFLDGNWLGKMLEAYDSDCLVCGGAIKFAPFQENRLIPCAQYFLQCNDFISSKGKREKRMLESCNIFCDKEIFEKAGGFPEIRAGEDVLFGLRAARITKLWFIPDACAYHIFRETMPGFLRNQFLLGEYGLIYRKRYYKTFIYRGMFPVLLLPLFIAIKLSLLTARVAASGLKNTCKLLICSPLVLLGACFWGAGFLKGTSSQG